MNEFNAKISEGSEEVTLEIFGAIDAGAKFPSLQTKKNVVIKFQNVTLMNSYGIKVWCKWTAELKDLPMIFLEECPFVFAKNFSSIRGFLTPNMKVRSFYVPFYSDGTHETKNVLMSMNKDFGENGFLNIPKAIDSKGAEMELDVDLRSYFQFLKK
jgi:hypothetical protein